MKRSTTFALILGVLFVCGLVAYATSAQSGGSGSADAWMAAQRQTPALWALDAVALYTLMLSASYGGQAMRLRSRTAQIESLQDEHRAQLEAIIANTDKAEEINAAQGNQITAQEDKIDAQEKAIQSLSEQTAALQQEITARQAELDARQEAFETEARRLTEQAFRALTGQVDANARQLDAVNLALQYHRAEIQQLRHGLRAVQPGSESTRVARLTPAEMTAITTQDVDFFEPVSDASNPDYASQTTDLTAPDGSDRSSDSGLDRLDSPTPEIVVDAATLTPSEASHTEPLHAEAVVSKLEVFGPADSEPIASDTLLNSEPTIPDDRYPTPDVRHALSENGPAAVIMETIHLRVVPDDSPSVFSSDAGGSQQEREAASGSSALPTPATVTDLVTPDEFSALLSPLTVDEKASYDDNSNAGPALSQGWLSGWQRTL